MYILKKKTHFMTKLGLFKKNTVCFNFQKSTNAINRAERKKNIRSSQQMQKVYFIKVNTHSCFFFFNHSKLEIEVNYISLKTFLKHYINVKY